MGARAVLKNVLITRGWVLSQPYIKKAFSHLRENAFLYTVLMNMTVNAHYFA